MRQWNHLRNPKNAVFKTTFLKWHCILNNHHQLPTSRCSKMASPHNWATKCYESSYAVEDGEAIAPSVPPCWRTGFHGTPGGKCHARHSPWQPAVITHPTGGTFKARRSTQRLLVLKNLYLGVRGCCYPSSNASLSLKPKVFLKILIQDTKCIPNTATVQIQRIQKGCHKLPCIGTTRAKEATCYYPTY